MLIILVERQTKSSFVLKNAKDLGIGQSVAPTVPFPTEERPAVFQCDALKMNGVYLCR